MGRPRAFSEEEVLDNVLQTFWARGFEATSVQDLVDATGLSRASLYGAFGDKEALFERVLERYRQQLGQLGAELLATSSAREGIERYLLRSLEVVCSRSGPRGCFVQVSASERQPAPPAVARAAAEGARATEAALQEALQRGKRAGEFSKSLDEKVTARLLGVALLGLGAAARTGRSAEELRAVVRQLVRMVD
jgi:TetR/AcrR family transcriptional repressor of nem operon